MRKLILFLFLLISFACQGQLYHEMYNDGKSLVEIESFFKNNYNSNSKSDKRIQKHYHRWKRNNAVIFNLPDDEQNFANKIKNEKKKALKNINPNTRNNYGDWENVSVSNSYRPNGVPNYGPVWDLEFDRLDGEKLYAGTEGGLWVKDGDSDWNYLTNETATLGISGIVAEGDDIYILTGSEQFRTFGVYHSANGGESWEYVDSLNNSGRGRRLVAHPDDLNIQYALTSQACHYTDDGWATSTLVSNFNYYDIEFHPSNPSMVYLGLSQSVIKAIDGQITDTLLTFPLSQATAIAVSPQPGQEDAIYVMNGYSQSGCGGQDTVLRQIWFSDDQGDNFTLKSDAPYNLGQACYNLELVVSPYNINLLWMSDIYTHVSADGGEAWGEVSKGNLHADCQDMLIHENMIYAATDGGISTRYLGAAPFLSWDASINEGLKVYTPNRIHVLEDNIAIGSDHNHTQTWEVGETSADWYAAGDGFHSYFNYDDPNTLFNKGQGAGFYINGAYKAGPNDKATWGQPFFQDPQDPNILWYCGEEIYQYNLTTASYSDNDFIEGDTMWVQGMDVSDNASDIGYFAASYRDNGVDQGVFRKFTWSLGSFTDLTANMPNITIRNISDIHVADNNVNDVLFTTEDYGDNIWHSFNGGISWTEIGGNLPNVPIYDIVRQQTNGQIYIATLLGVWYTNNDLNGEWIPYNQGLGMKWIRDIYIEDGYLYAGVRGNGVWRTEVISDCVAARILADWNDPSEGNPGLQRYAVSNFILNSRNSQGQSGTSVEMTAENKIILLPGFRATAIPTVKNNIQFGCQFKYSIDDCIVDE